MLDAPAARETHRAVWTGTEMIVWGGPAAGGRYDPALDSWSAMSMINAPAARAYPSAVWTGNEMIVWGGSNAGGPTNTGGRYDPVADVDADLHHQCPLSPRRTRSGLDRERDDGLGGGRIVRWAVRWAV